jgi:hypothetical protein
MSGDEFKGQIDTNFWGVVNVTLGDSSAPASTGQRSYHSN